MPLACEEKWAFSNTSLLLDARMRTTPTMSRMPFAERDDATRWETEAGGRLRLRVATGGPITNLAP